MQVITFNTVSPSSSSFSFLLVHEYICWLSGCVFCWAHAFNFFVNLSTHSFNHFISLLLSLLTGDVGALNFLLSREVDLFSFAILPFLSRPFSPLSWQEILGRYATERHLIVASPEHVKKSTSFHRGKANILSRHCTLPNFLELKFIAKPYIMITVRVASLSFKHVLNFS